MASPSHREICRIFYMVKGHLTASEDTMRNCYEGYFKRLWGNHEAVYHEDGFEEAYEKLKMSKIKDSEEDFVWQNIHPDDIWVMDKLILSRKLGYVCGPVGLDVPSPGYYIVRPVINMMGLGLGAQKVYIEKETMHLPVGHFWCEWFEGNHYSIDYNYGEQTLAVQGHKPEDTFTRWDEWRKIETYIPLPNILKQFKTREWLNCEYIGGKLIEVHFRRNEDFSNGISHFIPVWEGQDTTPPANYKYIEYPDVHGRIGAFVK